MIDIDLLFYEQEILFTRQKELKRGNKSLFCNDKLKTGRAETYIERTKTLFTNDHLARE